MNSVKHFDASRRRSRIVALMIALLLVALGAINLSATHASAAEYGPGKQYAGIGFIGAYRLANGQLAYCVEIAVPEPLGEQGNTQTVTTLPAFHSDYPLQGLGGYTRDTVEAGVLNNPVTMRQLNYVLETWGNTNNNAQAASVALAIFMIRGDRWDYTDRVVHVIKNSGGAAEVDTARAMVAEARADATAPIHGSQVQAPEISVDDTGVGTVKYFAGTRTLTLTNAIFTDSQTDTLTLDANTGGSVDIQAVRPDGWDRTFDVSVDADWKSGAEGWHAQVVLHPPVQQREQRIISPVGMSDSAVLSGTTTAKTQVHHEWFPTLHTQVSAQELIPGDPFVDTITLDADMEGDDWLQNELGEYMPLNLHGTLYGPLEDDPTIHPQQEAPEAAPIANEVTVLADEGPGDYEAHADLTAFHPGYYTWVWRIAWEEQAEEVINPARTGESALHSAAFPISHEYGLVAESHSVAGVEVRTQAQPEGKVGEHIYDTAYITGVVPAEATLEFAAYLYPREGDPVMSPSWQPEGDTVWTADMLATMSEQERCTAQPVFVSDRIPVTEAGEVESPAVRAASAGIVHWVETLYAVNPNTDTEEIVHEGACGQAEETTRVVESLAPDANPTEGTTPLAHTGVGTSTMWMLGGGGLSLLVGLIVVLRRVVMRM